MDTRNGEDILMDQDQALLNRIEAMLTRQGYDEQEVHPLDHLCQQLTHIVPVADATFRQQLEARLVTQLEAYKARERKPSSSLPAWSYGRRVAFGMLAVGCMLIAIVGAIPPARAWAGNSLDDLLLHFGFNRAAPVLPVATLPALATPNQVQQLKAEGPNTELSLAAVQGQVDYKVKLPTYLPDNYHAVDRLEFHPKDQWILWRAFKSEASHEGCGSLLQFSQFPSSNRVTSLDAIGTAAATTVSVGNETGLWIEKREESPCIFTAPGLAPRTIPEYQSVLTWEHDGIRYTLASDGQVNLSLDEMLKIGASLH